FSHGMGMGFGLGFLNFIGTILFIVAVFWVIKLIARGFRGCGYAGPGGDDDTGGSGGYGWGRHAWRGPGSHGYEYRYGGRGSHGRHGARHGGHGSSHGGPRQRDEALEVARERLARGQINTEEYERLRGGLANGAASGGSSAQEGHQAQSGGSRRPRRD